MTPTRWFSTLESLIPDPANALATALLAPVCAVCGALLDRPLTGCVCQNCWRSVRPITPPVCDKCGDPLARNHAFIPDRRSLSPVPSLESVTGHGVCGQCRKAEGAVDRARAIGEYDGALRAIVHALKYERRQSLAKRLALMMRSRGAQFLQHADFAVPVPLHWRREHARGFNQAREIARHLGPPVADMLIRRRPTRAQVELAADRRRGNVAGAFALRRGWLYDRRIRGTRLLLVDDVSTTGSTLDACARVLKEAGASEVCALTAARVVSIRRRLAP